MGHTNSTTNYALPQFLTTDKPAWLTDINGAMSDIDTGIHNAQTDATTAGNNATQALSDASAAATAASAADAKGAGACASIEASFDATAVYAVGAKVMYNSLLYRCNVAVVTPGPWTGSANWERVTVNSYIPTDAADLPLGNTTPAGSTAEAIANNASAITSKMDKIPDGSHTVYGVWGNSFYGSCRLWVAFPNANLYTITITSAKYRSADTTMTAITSPSIIVQNDCGFLVNAQLPNIGNNYGEVIFTTA